MHLAVRFINDGNKLVHERIVGNRIRIFQPVRIVVDMIIEIINLFVVHIVIDNLKDAVLGGFKINTVQCSRAVNFPGQLAEFQRRSVHLKYPDIKSSRG